MKIGDRISEAELAVLNLLWSTGKRAEGGNGWPGLGSGEIARALGEARGWDRSTVRTLLSRLVEKGAVTVEKQQSPSGRQELAFYRARIRQEEYIKDQTRGFIEKLYGGSARNLVAALVQDNTLTRQDIEELRTFFTSESAEDSGKGKKG